MFDMSSPNVSASSAEGVEGPAVLKVLTITVYKADEASYTGMLLGS